MTPKTAFAIMVVFCIALGLFRSLGPTVDGKRKIEIDFWNGWTGPDGVAMLQVIRRFNEENPDVEVTMQRIDWATYYNKLMVAELNSRGPEVFVIHASTLPRMFRAGFVSDATDLFDGQGGITQADFDPYVLDQVRFGREMIGLPLDIHPQGMYVNADLLKRAGIVNAQGNARAPTNREEFMKAVLATTKPSDDPGSSVWGFSLFNWRENFMTLLPQFDGGYFTKDGRADLANPGNVAALSFLVDLANRKLISPPENQSGWVGFRQNKVAMIFAGVYMLGDLLRLEDVHYFGAPIPVIGYHPGTLADSHVLCIKTGLSPAVREASERFIRYLSANSIAWAAAGQVPARRSMRAKPEFKKMQVQYAFSQEIPYMRYPPRATVLFELEQELDHATEMALRRQETPQQALEIASENLQRVLDRDAEQTGGLSALTGQSPPVSAKTPAARAAAGVKP